MATPQYHCKDCGVYRVLKPQIAHSRQSKETILKACQERMSLRGVQRVFKVSLSCQQRWYRIPPDYRSCQTISDAWHTYPEVIPKTLHRAVGKETGETAHVER